MFAITFRSDLETNANKQKKKKLEEPTAGAAQQPRVLEQFV